MENLFNRLGFQQLTDPATATDTVTSAACDTEGYPGIMLIVSYGASGDTLSDSVYWSAKLTSCATEGGTYADVDDGDVLGASTNAFGIVNATTEDDAAYGLCYNGSDRYVKVEVTAEGTHAYGTVIGVYAVKRLPRTVTDEFKVNP